MREILFKAKRIDNGEWVEASYVKSKPINEYARTQACILDCDDEIKSHLIYIYESTICQYTGLTDKNGKKIWENDILFDDDICSLVRWDDEAARFVIDDYGVKGAVMEYGFDEDAGEHGVVDTNGFDDFCSDANEIFEVIGNIFDNPELLKGE